MFNRLRLGKQVRKDIETYLCKVFPSERILSLERVIQHAVNEVFEASPGIGSGENNYNDRDISSACERTILHFLGSI